ncbi:MAG: isoamylase early set domain-containing protein [Chitinispirillaceae bacterium]|nr:isoamylase early set domain-containing protein [Chitinispirillaceae bacterium]
MKCRHVQSFFDRMCREGDRFDRPDIVAHVKQCGRCGRDYEKWCGIARKLEGVPALDAPPALYGRVMRAIEAQHAGAGAWLRWKPLPYCAVFAALMLIAATYLFIGMPWIAYRQSPVISSTSGAAPAEVMAHFEIYLAGARRVALVGDFNGWDLDKHLLTKSDADTWKIDLPIKKGCYQYLFLIDGTQWKTDPCRALQVPDGFGGINTVIEL